MRSMNELNVLHLPCCHVTYQRQLHDFLSFTNPLLCPYGIIKSPLDAHFSITQKVAGHLGTFRCYCFMNTVNSHILLASNILLVIHLQLIFSMSETDM